VSTLAGNPGQGGLQDGTGPGALFSFNAAPSIAVDGGGHVLVTEPFRVRRIDANGVTTTVAGSIQGTTGFADSSKPLDALFYGLSGIAVDAAGVIYVADGKNCLIRQIAPSGGVTTLAGSWPPGNQDGPSGVARFGKLGNLTLDSKGQYLYVADTTNNSIRKISTSDGTVTTVVGTRDIQGTVPGPLPATLNAPTGVAWDPTGPGHLLISVPDAILRVTF
jgi:DNA-binding beta-propeller fold protein YncE